MQRTKFALILICLNTKQMWGLLKTEYLSYIFLLKNQEEYWIIQVNLEK